MAKIDLLHIDTAIDEIFAEFCKQSREERKAALEAGAKVMANKLVAQSPRDPNSSDNFANHWEVKKYGANSCYIHNTKTTNTKNTGKGKKKAAKNRNNIPLSNIIEYSHGGANGFIRATADAAEGEVFNAIKNKLNGG